MTELQWEGSDLLIGGGTGVVAELVDVVVDLDEFGEPLGFELLGVLRRHPRMAQHLAGGMSAAVRITYDEEADAIYFRLAEGRSLDQEVRTAALAVGPSDELLSIRVPMEG